jgi:coronin-1B/1C/6
MSDRQVILWETGGMSSLETTVLDSSAGNLMPYFSDGNDVLFIAGKG